MSQIRITGRPEDWTDWDKLIVQCNDYTELTAFEIEKTKRGLLFLKQEFGDGFLKQSLEGLHPDSLKPDKVHPLISYFMNSAPWTRIWITRFSEKLQAVKYAEGYSDLLKRLCDNEKFFEALSVLEVGYKFSETGFNIVFDPIDKSFKKIPDLKLTNNETKEELFVEVSIQYLSANRTKAIRNFFEIHELLSPFEGLTYSGRILKILSDRHLNEVSAIVKNKIEFAKKYNSFQELVIDGVIELAIAPQKDKELLEKWCKSRALEYGTFSGPPVNIDDIPRTKQKIEREQHQLPKNFPNIIVVENNDLFRGIPEIKKEMSELEECLYEFPNLVCFIAIGFLECHDIAIQDQMLMNDQHIFIRRLRNDATMEQCMILLNRYCDFHLSPGTLSKIYLAFNKY